MQSNLSSILKYNVIPRERVNVTGCDTKDHGHHKGGHKGVTTEGPLRRGLLQKGSTTELRRGILQRVPLTKIVINVNH